MDTTRIEPLAVHILYDIGLSADCLPRTLFAERELKEIFHSEEVWKDIATRLSDYFTLAVYTPYDNKGDLKHKTLYEYLTETILIAYPRDTLDKKHLLADMLGRCPRWCAEHLYSVNTVMNFQNTLDKMFVDYIKYARPFMQPCIQRYIIEELGFTFKEKDYEI